MKKLFSIVFISALLIGICFLEEIFLHNAINNIENYTNSVLTSISANEENINTNEINVKLEEFDSFWKKEEKKLCVFTNYEKIKAVDESLGKLKYAIKNNDENLAIENIAMIKSFTHFLHYIMGFNLNNLF